MFKITTNKSVNMPILTTAKIVLLNLGEHNNGKYYDGIVINSGEDNLVPDDFVSAFGNNWPTVEYSRDSPTSTTFSWKTVI